MNKRAIFLFVVLGVRGAFPVFGNEAEANAPSTKSSMKELMTDPEDGKFDVSEWLSTAQGFFPAVTIITEPAVGYGAGVMLMFFHDSIENRAKLVKERNSDGTPKRLPPPSISGLFGMGTENGTWGAGAYHMGIWKDDTVRYLGAVGYMSPNLDFYVADQSVPFNLESPFLLQQVVFRLGESDFFAGGNYKFSSTKATPDTDIPLPPLLGNGVETQAGGASGILEYDSRDNIFTPNIGLNSKGEWTHYDTWLGSDRQFDLLTLENRAWHPLTESLILGMRLDGNFSSSDVPFYMRPFVKIRGIPAVRYQGDHVLTAEAELRWDFTTRWSLIGFAGAGWTADDNLSDFGTSDTYPAGGFGFRYLVARVFNLRAGIDVGFSEEASAIYITTGSAWGR